MVLQFRRVLHATAGSGVSLLVCALLCLGAGAQSAVDGAIGGRVSGEHGVKISGAIVRATHTADGLEESTTTGHHGEFLLTHLPAGEYRLSISAPALPVFVAEQVPVEVGRVTSLAVPLLADTALLLHAIQAGYTDDVATNISRDDVQSLPVNDLHWSNLSLLASGTNVDENGEGQISYRGLAPTQNSNALDGGDSTQGFLGLPMGGAHGNAAVSQDVIREFQASASGSFAQYGHAAGGSINAITRSGGSEVHGAGYYYLSNSAWAAIAPFSVVSSFNAATGLAGNYLANPSDVREQAGGDLGGPLLRRKLFYFLSYEQQQRNFPGIAAPEDPNFFALTANQMAALTYTRKLTQAQIVSALGYLSSLTGPVPRTNDQNNSFAKLNWNAGERNRLSMEYNRMRQNSPAGGQSQPVVYRGTSSFGNTAARVDTALGRWITFFTENLSNELRVQYSHDFESETAQTPLPQEPLTGPNGYPPEVRIGPNGFTIGKPNSLNRAAYPDETRYQAAEILSWVKGRHLISGGFDGSHLSEYISNLSGADGYYSYDTTSTTDPGALVDWMTDYTFSALVYPTAGCPSGASSPGSYEYVHYYCYREFTQSFGPSNWSYLVNDYAGFIEDKWKATEKLTLSLGARYEYEQLPPPQQPNPVINALFSGTGTTSSFPSNGNNIGPRFGFAWSPVRSGRTVLRGGYGIFYGRLAGTIIKDALANTAIPTAADSHILIKPKTVTSSPTCYNSGIATFGYPCTFPLYPQGDAAKTTSAVLFDSRFHLPMVQQANITLESDLGRHIMLSATYMLSMSRELPNFVDINIAPASSVQTFQLQGGTGKVGAVDGEKFLIPVYSSRVDTTHGPVTAIRSNINGTYNAFSLEARRRFEHGLEVRVGGTFSKAIDYGQPVTGNSVHSNPFDPFQIRYDKSVSSFNYPHKAIVSILWEPRLHTHNAELSAIMNQWSLSPIFIESSGRPYSYEIDGGSSLSGGYPSINGSGGATYLPTCGPNTLRLPDTQNFDVRLGRRIKISERVHAQAMAEVFNTLNHTNGFSVSTVAYRVGTPVNGVTPLVFQNAASVLTESSPNLPFGEYTAARSSFYHQRQVQIAFRLEF